jgi:hypothetical protein
VVQLPDLQESLTCTFYENAQLILLRILGEPAAPDARPKARPLGVTVRPLWARMSGSCGGTGSAP